MPWGADSLLKERSMLNFDFRAPLSVKTKAIAYHLYQTEAGHDVTARPSTVYLRNIGTRKNCSPSVIGLKQ